ncbi:hypothetical protein IWX90DRAFT_63619 [Phyllosticta citrichinensis]|uniref:Phenazine biosynthesis protein n=1 Tax=Phyllosticta citrichinensis TaxID=1130410 RepID=A0ABR1XHA8_9PEZI
MAGTRLEYCTFDVFTLQRFAGNPLAIVHVPASTELGQGDKQIVAREFNYSETVFLHAQEHGRANTWRIDIFLTTAEVPFAGHPTIGTAVCALSRLPAAPGQDGRPVEGTFITKAGEIPVSYYPNDGVATARIPHNVHIHECVLSRTQLLQIQPSIAILDSAKRPRVPSRSPVVSIVKGMTFALIEVDSLATLNAVATGSFSVDVPLDKDWDQSFVALYFYFRQADSTDGTRNLRTRMVEGTLEDPATGSAASALACYLSLVDHHAGGDDEGGGGGGAPGQTLKYRILQGVEMGRKSDIGVELTLAPPTAANRPRAVETVVLSGSAVRIMEGNLSL